MKLDLTYRSLLTVPALLATAWACLAAGSPQATSPAVLTAMQDELDRSMATMSKADPGTYFLSYTVSDRQYTQVSGSNGALLSSTADRARWLEVQSRVGNYQ